MFDNRYGTGQSTLDGIIRATNRLVAGQVFVVLDTAGAAAGWPRAPRAWAPTWSSPRWTRIKALEATMDGYRVMPSLEAAAIGDFFCHGDRQFRGSSPASTSRA